MKWHFAILSLALAITLTTALTLSTRADTLPDLIDLPGHDTKSYAQSSNSILPTIPAITTPQPPPRPNPSRPATLNLDLPSQDSPRLNSRATPPGELLGNFYISRRPDTRTFYSPTAVLPRDRTYVVTVLATRLIRDVNVWVVFDEAWDRLPTAVAHVHDHQSNSVTLAFDLRRPNATSPVAHVMVEVEFWWSLSAGIIGLWRAGS